MVMIDAGRVDWSVTRAARKVAGIADYEPTPTRDTFSVLGTKPASLDSSYSGGNSVRSTVPTQPKSQQTVILVRVEWEASYSPAYDPYWDSGHGHGYGHHRPPVQLPRVTSHTSRASGITYTVENSPHTDRSTAWFNQSYLLCSPIRMVTPQGIPATLSSRIHTRLSPEGHHYSLWARFLLLPPSLQEAILPSLESPTLALDNQR